MYLGISISNNGQEKQDSRRSSRYWSLEIFMVGLIKTKDSLVWYSGSSIFSNFFWRVDVFRCWSWLMTSIRLLMLGRGKGFGVKFFGRKKKFKIFLHDGFLLKKSKRQFQE